MPSFGGFAGLIFSTKGASYRSPGQRPGWLSTLSQALQGIRVNLSAESPLGIEIRTFAPVVAAVFH
jgi:hypothetical protein